MSILDVINSVCDVVSLDQFGSVYGSSDPQASTMLEMAKIGGEEIAGRFDWKCLEKVSPIEQIPSPLPEDYDRMIDGGAVMSVIGDFYRPVKNPSQWTVIKRVASVTPFFYLNGQKIEFSPVADAVGGTLTYITKNWIIGSDTKGKTDWSSDDDTVAFPEDLLVLDLIWRWKRQKGLAYDDPLAEFEAALGAATEEDRG
ncbi:hypothetical protein [Neorhizobium sp. NCHU2750]|uniref:hypothetical protein n=1 Tax=Neorhizobium sp. NCHU2750 TaxID=1825976 RepID=UPI000E75F249|nr:hypothetical protein NCHU2750_28110 [Neorhizobium sp. NCHU2750]